MIHPWASSLALIIFYICDSYFLFENFIKMKNLFVLLFIFLNGKSILTAFLVASVFTTYERFLIKVLKKCILTFFFI